MLPAPVRPKLNQFCTLSVCSLYPVVACTGLPKDDLPLHTVVACNGLPKDAVVCAFSRLLPTPVYPKTKLFSLKGWSKGVHQNGTWHVAVSPLRVPRTNCFVEVYIDAFKLLNDLKNSRQKMTSVLCCF